MKTKCYLLASFVLLCSFSARAQCNATISLSTQAAVNAYPATYGCATLTNLEIIRSSDITNLDSLYQIISVGVLTIESNAILTNLQGLSNLTDVNNLYIQSNSVLQNLNGLGSLRAARIILWISSNVALTSLHGLEGLRTVNELDIRFNDGLTDLAALSGLTAIDGPLTIRSDNGLTGLTGLNNITTVGGDATFQENAQLASLDALSGVTHSSGLMLISNPALSNVDGLSSLQTVGRVSITGNQALTNLSGLSSLTSIGSTTITNNQVLSNLLGLSGVTTATGDLNIDNNPALTNLDGLKHITTIPGELSIGNNNGLTNLHGLGSITHTGLLFIEQNSNLVSLDGFEGLVSVGGGSCQCIEPGLIITGNGKLTNVNALSSLTTVSDNLEISSNAVLVNLDGLHSLATVGQMLSISANPSLTNLDGLRALTSVGIQQESAQQGLVVSNNAALTSISGLRNLLGVAGGLYFQNNQALPNLIGLESVTHVGGLGLQIDGNPALTNIDALSSITTVANGVVILNNAALINLNGLGSLTSIGGGFSVALIISNNAVLANVDSLSSLTSLSGGNKSVTVTDNPNLTKGCGLYPLLHGNLGCSSPCGGTFTFSGNGPSVTREAILAGGSCGSSSSTQPSALIFSHITDNSIQISFTSPTDMPTGGYLVLIRAYGSPFPADVPVDGTTYHVGDVIGSSTIVIGIGQQTTHNVVDLLPSTPYYMDVFSYSSTFDYLTTNPLAGNQATATLVAQPTKLVFSSITDNEMTVSFTAASPAGDGYITVMRAFGSPYPEDAPQDGNVYHVGDAIGSSTIVVGLGTATSLNIVYLEPDLAYYFDVVSYRVAGGFYDYATDNPLAGNQRTTAGGSALSSSLRSESVPYPNPFTGSIAIPFTIKTENTFVHIAIYDQIGNPVANVVSDRFAAGHHEVMWDRSDFNGNKVGEGFYIYSFKSSEPGKSLRGILIAK